MGKSSSPSLPKPPNLSKSYGKGVDVYLKYLPQLLGAEESSREKIDPQRIQQQQGLQDQYGAKQYQQQLDALNQLDPHFTQVRNQLGDTVNQDLSAGYTQTPDQLRQTEQYVRAAQAARGNTDGGAASTAEAYALGDKGFQMHQQRLANAGAFLQSPSAVQMAGQIAPVSPDRSFSYVNPNAGYLGSQFALQNYQNQVAASQASSGGSSPWGTIGSVIGTVGQIAGLVGMFASDKRVKKDIEKVGTAPSGANIYEFAYKKNAPVSVPRGKRFRGVMAQDVEKKIPSAVVTDPVTGVKKVDYSKVGVPMQRVA